MNVRNDDLHIMILYIVYVIISPVNAFSFKIYAVEKCIFNFRYSSLMNSNWISNI
jgi:hypothetical protein